MTDIRISAADLLRLAAIASVSPEGTAEEVVAILQHTALAGPALATAEAPEGSSDAAAGDDSADKFAKPE